MTHSLHREGSSNELENDYVILITPAIGINDHSSGEKLGKYLQILLEEGVTNIGDVEHGSILGSLNQETLQSYMADGKRIRACISDLDHLRRILSRLNKEDLGLSVTVSGLIDKIYKVANEIGIKPHTINMSLGVWGKTEVLPDEDIRKITTLCGHHMISQYLVKEMISKIKEGIITPELASNSIGRLCVCGIFNQEQCHRLFESYDK